MPFLLPDSCSLSMPFLLPDSCLFARRWWWGVCACACDFVCARVCAHVYVCMCVYRLRHAHQQPGFTYFYTDPYKRTTFSAYLYRLLEGIC